MVETIVRDFINKYGTVNAYMERPENAPDTYYLIEKTGSRTADKLTTSTIIIQSYAKTLYAAAVLNDEIVALMDTLPDYSKDVAGVHLNTDYNFTDAAAKQYRYQAVFTITHY